MTTFAELTYEDEHGDRRVICTRATGAECWRLIDKYQGQSPHWPKSGCYVVKVVRTLIRRRGKRAV